MHKWRAADRRFFVSFRAGGFTLIELMIVVAILAVIAAVALPAYFDSIRKSRRAEAVTAVSAILQAQERWRANCPCFAGSITAAGGACPAVCGANTVGLNIPAAANARYTYALSTTAAPASWATQYTITATATAAGGQTKDRAAGASCSVLTATMTNGNVVNAPAACWSR